MELKCVQVATTMVSTIAACVSVFFAMKSQKLQRSLIKNKSAIEEINDLISKLQVANAIHQHALAFPDEEFEEGIDMSDVPSKVAKLIQHDQISNRIKMSEWTLPIESLTNKISILQTIRDELL